MMHGQDDSRLYSQLGGLSIWSLRKHLLRGNVRPTRLGRRVFLSTAEISRIQREGLPSLSSTKAEGKGKTEVSDAERKDRTRVSKGHANEGQR
jgi:hypothetical protein